MRVGVVSDTHGRFDPALTSLFSGCDHILHCGDIGDERVVRRLEEIAPVTAVLGNVDYLTLAGRFPEIATIRLAGSRILVTHLLGTPEEPIEPVRERLVAEPADVVVFGHSHRAHNRWIGGTLFFNPGSAGPKRFTHPRTAGSLAFEPGGNVVARIYDLDELATADGARPILPFDELPLRKPELS
jgi:putative phosphoesterase